MADELEGVSPKETRQGLSRRDLLVAGTAMAATAVTLAGPTPAKAQAASTGGSGRKPNILMIMGDDIGWFNPSIYHRGMMGYRTPNIDRIGNEGRCLPTGMASRAARPDEQLSSQVSRRSGQD